MNSKERAFVRTVRAHYKAAGRHALPWRKTRDPYKILVSEVMLQQTQVDRVFPYYNTWIRTFPKVEDLAHAPLKEVLMLWQGLGYNRRAKALHTCARELLRLSTFPKDTKTLESLSGIGPYTARAILCFAFNADEVLIETNIRTAILHHFFSGTKKVSDEEILHVLERVHQQGDARTWYAALMDYGAYLKKSGIRLNARTTSYTKQKPFKGSSREARGAILRALSKASCGEKTLLSVCGKERVGQVKTQLVALMREKLVEKKGRRFVLAS